MASQPKVELPHAVVSVVVCPHGCKYLTDQAEVLLDRLHIEMLPLRGKKSGKDALDENLEEGNGVLNVPEIRGNFKPVTEALPLAPGDGVSLEYGCSKLAAACTRMEGGADAKARSVRIVCGSEKEIACMVGEEAATRRLPSYYPILGHVLWMRVCFASWLLNIFPSG